MKKFKSQLLKQMIETCFEEKEAISEIDFLISVICKKDKKDFYLNPTLTISDKEKTIIKNLIKRRIDECLPVQYLVNKAYFMNEEFFVDKNVLIPRPETELLVKKTEEIIKQNILEKKDFKILDIGTGSGCIPIMLAKMFSSENINFFACDISPKALEIAKKNAQKHNLEDKIKFVLSDLFSIIHEKFDLIISNPPYIPLHTKETLQKEVALHEPSCALFAADEAGIEFYEKIIRESQNFLNDNGTIIFEIGIGQFEKVKEIFLKNNFKNIAAFKDLEGIHRVIQACKN